MTGTPEPPAAPEPGPAPELAVELDPPMLPSRGAYLLAFAAVVVAGVLGAVIGYGITDVSSDSDVAIFVGTLVGAAVGAAGVGVVAVLVLRAMAEWKRQPRPTEPVRRRS
ncbi:MAG: hypothetical protein ACHQIG_02285 [Acidimicrobiia bacterium]